MKIKNCVVQNYKSFFGSPSIPFGDGFNVIVGQNNVGKTALVEALSLRFADKPHRSLIQNPSVSAPLTQSTSSVTIEFELDTDEFVNLVESQWTHLHIPTDHTSHIEQQFGEFQRLFRKSQVGLSVHYGSKNLISAHFVGIANIQSGEAMHIDFSTTDKKPRLVYNSFVGVSKEQQLPYLLGDLLRNRIYMFRAERLNVSEYNVGGERRLEANAANLPQVLNVLQTSNPVRFHKFNSFVTTIFPDVKQITIPPNPANSNQLRIFVWTIDPSSQREDLAMPLSESGTGIGQVLAILYVVMTSEFPQVIIIDEPQSFLHPGAVRKLFSVLKTYYPQHQYIITTHSANAIAAAEPERIIKVHKEQMESIVEHISVEETHKMGEALSELGVRLSDVFGADNILWVEGRTEEECFPLIWSKIAKNPLLGTVILGVRQTGDFEGKHANTVLSIYRKLSEGRNLIPPAIGFIFDKEKKTDVEQADLQRQSKGLVHFLPRHMYENYLLYPDAIVAIINVQGGSVTSEMVENSLIEIMGDNTLSDVHGASVLTKLFRKHTDNIEYDKVRHGYALTLWLVENAPDQLQEVAMLIENVLQEPVA